MKKIVIQLPDQLKARLDAKRLEGVSIAGLVRHLLTRELADKPRVRRKNSRVA